MKGTYLHKTIVMLDLLYASLAAVSYDGRAEGCGLSNTKDDIIKRKPQRRVDNIEWL